MATNKIFVQGGGGHAKVVIDCLQAQGMEVLTIVDSKFEGPLFGITRTKNYPSALDPAIQTIIAIGDNQVRKKLSLASTHPFANAIHPSVILSKHASIGTGNMILHGAIIQANTSLKNHIIVNTGAQIDHDCQIEDYCHIGPGVVLCGSISVGEGTFIGAGAVVIPGVKIGSWAIIGAGATVVSDIPDHAVAVGTPAKVINHARK